MEMEADTRTCENCGAEKPIPEMNLQEDRSTWLCNDCDEAAFYSSLPVIGSKAELHTQHRLERDYWRKRRKRSRRLDSGAYRG